MDLIFTGGGVDGAPHGLAVHGDMTAEEFAAPVLKNAHKGGWFQHDKDVAKDIMRGSAAG